LFFFATTKLDNAFNFVKALILKGKVKYYRQLFNNKYLFKSVGTGSKKEIQKTVEGLQPVTRKDYVRCAQFWKNTILFEPL